MDIKNPKRIMVVGSRDAGILDVVKAPKSDDSGSIAGLMHQLDLRTAYYRAKVPIWIDELADPDAWQAEFIKPIAKEVVEAIGAWIFCFQRSRDDDPISERVQKALKSIQAVVEQHNESYAADAVLLAVAVPVGKRPITQNDPVGSYEEGEEKCREFGFEYIDYAATGTNDYGEKVGIDRLREALETAEWDDADKDGDDLDLGFASGDDGDFSNRDEAEMTAEIYEMKTALGDNATPDIDTEDFTPASEQAVQVDDLEKIMSRLLAIKEQGASLPLAQRKKLAAKAIKELMKTDEPGT